MSDKTYKILWIDDEYAKLGALIRSAKDFGIQLVPFKSLDGGMTELEKNYSNYDGILLDAKFIEFEDDVAGTEDTEYSFRAKERIANIPKKFEIFILTGQAEAFDDNTFNKIFKQVYRKGIDKDEDKLFKNLIKAADKQEDTQIRHRYYRAFEVCREKYIGEYASQDLLMILKNIDDANVEHYFNTVRKIIEDLFSAFNKCELLPDEFVKPSVALNESSRFLQGKDHKGEYQIVKGYTHKEGTHLPQLISSSLWSILTTVQDASHRALIDDHIKALKAPYLLQSVVFRLLDVIVWFKQYIDSNPQKNNWIRLEENTPMQKDSEEWILGEVYELKGNGWGSFCSECGKHQLGIPDFMVRKNSLISGSLVKVTLKADNNKHIDKVIKQ